MKWISLNTSKIKVYGKKSKLVIKGISEEHKAFLHNLFTNDINNLLPYKFNYNLRLKGNGHPIQDFFVFNFGDYFIIDTEESAEKVIEEFNKLKLSMQVFFENLTSQMQHIFLYGDDSSEFVKDSFGIELNNFEFKQIENIVIAKNPLRNGETGYDIFGDLEKVLSILNKEDKVSFEEFEHTRINNCIPKIHKELKEGYLPLETPITPYAISFTKGCYIGQEAIARAHFRGNPPRTLVKFELIDNIQEGEKIIDEDKKIGEITSISSIESVGIGYILKAKLKEDVVYITENNKKVKLVGECKINGKIT